MRLEGLKNRRDRVRPLPDVLYLVLSQPVVARWKLLVEWRTLWVHHDPHPDLVAIARHADDMVTIGLTEFNVVNGRPAGASMDWSIDHSILSEPPSRPSPGLPVQEM